MDSPFPHHGPLAAEQVIGRDDLVADLVERATSRRVTALLGPRRFGKTSVLRRVAAELGDTSVVWLDLYEATSMDDIALRLDRALADASGRVARELRSYTAAVGVDLGVFSASLSRTEQNVTATLHVLLDALVEGAQRTPTTLIIDEFSSIARVDGAAGLLRTKLQHHVQSIGLLFAGSEPSTMRALFGSRDQPFFGQADTVSISPLDRATVNALIEVGFDTTDRDPGDLAARVYDMTGGHPRRTMQLADAAWRAVEPDRPWDAAAWETTISAVRHQTADGLEVLFSQFDRSEQSVVRIVASGGSVWGRAAARLGLNPSPAKLAIARLEDAGHLARDDGKLEVIDPLLADWLRRTLPA